MTFAKQVFNHEHQANGLFARFLFARPPEPRRRWRCSRSAARFADVVLAHFKRLQELNPPPAGEEPMAIGLSTEAESVYEPWFNAHNELREGTDDNLVRSILAKIEEVPARLALVLELAQAKDPTTVRQVSQETMHRAIGLANWFRHEAERAWALINETDDHRRSRLTLEFVERKGPVTAAILARSMRLYRKPGGSQEAEKCLRQLVAARAVEPCESPSGGKGGRPTTWYKSCRAVSVSESPKKPGNRPVSETETAAVHADEETETWEA